MTSPEQLPSPMGGGSGSDTKHTPTPCTAHTLARLGKEMEPWEEVSTCTAVRLSAGSRPGTPRVVPAADRVPATPLGAANMPST